MEECLCQMRRKKCEFAGWCEYSNKKMSTTNQTAANSMCACKGGGGRPFLVQIEVYTREEAQVQYSVKYDIMRCTCGMVHSIDKCVQEAI